ncbi:acyl-CoA dehydrogenase family protein [Nocardia jejuensis]|uniref:acyl-CoA dehydrogenase family protein n=1 Tax=Nocardia jejuensis TaxID=328049 RepID=UPI00082F8341|nr:acyl-CoA dehydrogenase family protein [Nocardia jejuensis]
MSEDIALLDTDTEAALRDSIRSLLSDRCDPAQVLHAYSGDRTLTTALWRPIAVELGLAGLLIPESRGGAGGSARDAAVVLQELGRYVAPVPFLSSSVIAATVLLAGDSDLVGRLALGEITAALLASFSEVSAARIPVLHIDSDGSLSGRVRSVAGALDSDVLLAAVRTGAGTEIHAVPSSRARLDPVISLDMTRPLADVTLSRVPGRVVVPASAGAAALRQSLRMGAGLLAAEQVGVADWCLDNTVEYVKIRRQFGRAIGGFQALKHRLADLYVEIESARATAAYAAGTLATADPDTEVAVAVAAAHCGDVAVHAAEEAVQLLGGIGMTWEYPAHLYLKRAKADQLGLGSPAQHRSRLAELIQLRLETVRTRES